MARGKRKNTPPPPPPPWKEAWDALAVNAVLARIMGRTDLRPRGDLPRSAWVQLDRSGILYINSDRGGFPAEWKYVLAHALLHLGHGHHLIPVDADPLLWNLAADIQIAGLLAACADGGWAPDGYRLAEDLPRRMSVREHQRLAGHPGVERYRSAGGGDLLVGGRVQRRSRYGTGQVREWTPADWQALLAAGLREYAADAIDDVAAQGWREDKPKSQARLVLAWFMANYPLLSSVAAGFTLIEDERACRARDIAVAAVEPARRRIYLNPRAGLNEEELRFVIAHEILHVALMHQERCGGRDPYLWNVSCDYVINRWLVQMRVGQMPQVGLLYDEALDGLTSEEIYARLTQDVRRARKLVSLRGQGLGDMLGDGDRHPGEAASLEDWVRGALRAGLELHHQRGRGDLPADLVEQIEAMAADPVPWDARLAEWFQTQFPPREPQRSYARASRRQSATPDIARPGRADRRSDRPSRMFCVVLDTSASMSSGDLSRALGSIISYALAHEVEAVRLIDCDAQPYDRGWVEVESLRGVVEVHGRGGTKLQPGLNLLDSSNDLPADAPVMIITDGAYEQELTTRREHCYLLPPGAWPWYPTHGPVFTMD